MTARWACALLVALVCCALPATADARAGKRCPRSGVQVVADEVTRVYHVGATLKACSRAGDRRTVRKLGPWTPGTQAAVSDGFRDDHVVLWTTRKDIGGSVVDRVWAGWADGSTWLRDASAVPAAGERSPAMDSRVVKLASGLDTVGWVTDTGAMALSFEHPQIDPMPVGQLPTPLVTPVDGQPLLVGTFGTAAVPALIATLQLTGEAVGDSDECAGGFATSLTAQPTGEGPRVGASWGGYWRVPCP